MRPDFGWLCNPGSNVFAASLRRPDRCPFVKNHPQLPLPGPGYSKTLRSLRDQWDRRKLQTNRRKQLEPRHARHLQIGDYDVGKTSFHLKQSRQSIPSRSHSVASLSQQRGDSYTQVTVILHQLDGCLMGGHKNFLLGAAGIGWLILAPSIPLVGGGDLLTFAQTSMNFR